MNQEEDGAHMNQEEFDKIVADPDCQLPPGWSFRLAPIPSIVELYEKGKLEDGHLSHSFCIPFNGEEAHGWLCDIHEVRRWTKGLWKRESLYSSLVIVLAISHILREYS